MIYRLVDNKLYYFRLFWYLFGRFIWGIYWATKEPLYIKFVYFDVYFDVYLGDLFGGFIWGIYWATKEPLYIKFVYLYRLVEKAIINYNVLYIYFNLLFFARASISTYFFL